MRSLLRKARGHLEELFKDAYDESPKVIETEGAKLTEEVGSLDQLTGPRIAILSSWSATPVMSRSLSEYLKELDRMGYQTVVVNTSDVDAPLEWPHGLPDSVVVTRRKNIGYDFGSWSAALHAMPWVRSQPYVLLTNDSMVGPFSSMDAIFLEAEDSSADVFGLTESYQIIHHAQSFFLLFKRGVLDDPAWIRFFESVRPQKEKVQVIQAYELGLSRYCAREGYSWETFATAYACGAGRENPTLNGWRQLLDFGVPFIKRNMLLDANMPSTSMEMTQEIAYRYGENVQDWLPPGHQLGFKKSEGEQT